MFQNLIREVYTEHLPKNVILEPQIGEVVLIKRKDEFIPVKITDGAFFHNGRISNFWYWTNLKTERKESGYGGFYKAEKE